MLPHSIEVATPARRLTGTVLRYITSHHRRLSERFLAATAFFLAAAAADELELEALASLESPVAVASVEVEVAASSVVVDAASSSDGLAWMLVINRACEA